MASRIQSTTLASSSSAAAALPLSTPKVATDAPEKLAKKPCTPPSQQQDQQHRRQERKRRRSRPPPPPPSLLSRLLVRSVGRTVQDPRELQTILWFSLRNLWGELEAHSGHVQVTKQPSASLSLTQENSDDDDDDNDGDAYPRSRRSRDESTLFEVTCLTESVDAVRAALTMVTPPPYLEKGVGEGGVSLFRFDVLEVVPQPSSSDPING